MAEFTREGAEPGARAARRWWGAVALVAAFGLVEGLLSFGHLYLDDVTRGVAGTMTARLIEELTAGFGGALLFVLVLVVARRWPLRRGVWLRHLPAHVAAVVAISVAHTTLNYLSRSALFPLFGLGPYDYGNLRVRYWMEFPSDVLWYILLVALVHLFDAYRRGRDHAVRAARLESRLAQAQLQNLRLQLQPHFLFNALNTISSVMYEDVRAADAMLGKLADLLRHTLRAPHAQETTLDDELRALGLYIDLMRARFDERLRVTVSTEPGTEHALVPQLVLQPLVENAFRHGLDPATARGEVEVHCARRNGSLRLEVRDHGRGLALAPGDALARGVGLSNTAARLAQLYGDAHRLELANAADGGLRVTITIPFRAADAPAPDPAAVP